MTLRKILKVFAKKFIINSDCNFTPHPSLTRHLLPKEKAWLPLCLGFPSGGSCPHLRTVEGYFITPAPHPSLARHLLPKEKACLPSFSPRRRLVCRLACLSSPPPRRRLEFRSHPQGEGVLAVFLSNGVNKGRTWVYSVAKRNCE